MIFQKNYHTHTFRCKHAKGDIEDYCLVAINNNLNTLGFSDHTPFPDNRWSWVRMEINQLDEYCNKIEQAKERFKGLEILKGLECEFVPEFLSFYKEELLEKYKIEYLVGAIHWFPHNGSWIDLSQADSSKKHLHSYTDYFIKSLESKLFSFFAHPDAFGCFYLEWDQEAIACSKIMLQAAKNYDIPLEINAFGLRKPIITTPQGKRAMYPLSPFWKLAKEFDIKVIINSDAHSPNDLILKTEEAINIAEQYNLTIVDINKEILL